jgi:hypothetical protein
MLKVDLAPETFAGPNFVKQTVSLLGLGWYSTRTQTNSLLYEAQTTTVSAYMTVGIGCSRLSAKLESRGFLNVYWEPGRDSGV